MSVQHETEIEFALDAARDLPEGLIPPELKERLIGLCLDAYRLADGLPEDDYARANEGAFKALALLTEARRLVPVDEKPLRRLWRLLLQAEEALNAFLAYSS